MRALVRWSAFVLVPAAWLAGCGGNTVCRTSSECGSTEACVSNLCQAISCGQSYFAVDPSSGECEPVAGCGNDLSVRGWLSCQDPCESLSEAECAGDGRCEPGYSLPQGQCVGIAEPQASATGGTRSDASLGGDPCLAPPAFLGCRPRPVEPIDSCRGLGAQACSSNARCNWIEPMYDCACAFDDQFPCECDGGRDYAGECVERSCWDLDVETCKTDSRCALEMGSPLLRGGKEPTPVPAPDDRELGPLCARPTESDGLQPNCIGPDPEPAPPTTLTCVPRDACKGLGEAECLSMPGCAPLVEPCWCPPNATCKCAGGAFLGCTGAYYYNGGGEDRAGTNSVAPATTGGAP